MQSTVRSIDPVAKRVETDAGSFEADVLVVALGADLHPDATPGLVEGGHEFYTVAGAFGLRDVLADFAGGRVIVAVTSTPFKCPPAPSETALLMHDHPHRAVDSESVSEIALVMPFGVPMPPSPAASQALLGAFAERGIDWYPEKLVRGLDPARKVALLSDDTEMPYDLFLGVPVHRAPTVVEESALAVDGWIPVDPLTLETSFPDVYAVGDVTSVGTPKAGVFAEGQAAVVADADQRAHPRPPRRRRRTTATGCVTSSSVKTRSPRVDVTFLSGQMPKGHMEGPSSALAAHKVEFGTSRIQRWFGQTWPTAG